MNKNDVLKKIQENPNFHLATIANGFPKVRGMLAYKVDEEGLVFHTARTKDVYEQLVNNPVAEVCFNLRDGLQIRINGTVEDITSEIVIDEIMEHPSRAFLRNWKRQGHIKDIYIDLTVFKFKFEKATIWTMDTNFESKSYISML